MDLFAVTTEWLVHFATTMLRIIDLVLLCSGPVGRVSSESFGSAFCSYTTLFRFFTLTSLQGINADISNLQLFFSFFGLSSFYLAFFFLCDSATSNPAHDPFGGHGLDVISVANSLCSFILLLPLPCLCG